MSRLKRYGLLILIYIQIAISTSRAPLWWLHAFIGGMLLMEIIIRAFPDRPKGLSYRQHHLRLWFIDIITSFPPEIRKSIKTDDFEPVAKMIAANLATDLGVIVNVEAAKKEKTDTIQSPEGS